MGLHAIVRVIAGQPGSRTVFSASYKWALFVSSLKLRVLGNPLGVPTCAGISSPASSSEPAMTATYRHVQNIIVVRRLW